MIVYALRKISNFYGQKQFLFLYTIWYYKRKLADIVALCQRLLLYRRDLAEEVVEGLCSSNTKFLVYGIIHVKNV